MYIASYTTYYFLFKKNIPSGLNYLKFAIIILNRAVCYCCVVSWNVEFLVVGDCQLRTFLSLVHFLQKQKNPSFCFKNVRISVYKHFLSAAACQTKVEIKKKWCINISTFCFVSFCFVFLCFVLLCFALLCFALLCFALLCFALLCFALLCFALLLFVLLLVTLLFTLFCVFINFFVCFHFQVCIIVQRQMFQWRQHERYVFYFLLILFCFALFFFLLRFVLFCFVLFCFFSIVVNDV